MATAPPATRARSAHRVAWRRGQFLQLCRRLAFATAAWCAFVAPASGDTVTFSRQIAPIVYRTCGECHRPGGSAPFSLTDYSAARQHARQMLAAIKSGAMPPWKSEPGYGDFVGQPRLAPSDVRLIERWIE